MSSNLDKVLSDFRVVYQYNTVDKFDNAQYIFTVEHDASLKKLASFLKKNSTMVNNFTFTKDGLVYIRVKPRHIKDFNKIKFVKNQPYKTILNLIYYDFLNKKGYYPKMAFVEDSSSSSDLDE